MKLLALRRARVATLALTSGSLISAALIGASPAHAAACVESATTGSQIVGGVTYTSQVIQFTGAGCTATWSVPARATVEALVVGGGGGGGGGVTAADGTKRAGGGGGGGGAETLTSTYFATASTVSLSVGTGGTAGSGSGAGGNGTSSELSSASTAFATVTASGGFGGASGTPGNGGSSGGSTPYAGGTGTSGSGNVFAAGGGGARGAGNDDGTGGTGYTWPIRGTGFGGGGSGGGYIGTGERKVARDGGGLGVSDQYCLQLAGANSGGGGGGGAGNANVCSPNPGAGADGVVQISYVTTVAFDPNGAAGTSTTQTRGASGALAANPFTRAGYSFAGWSTLPGGGGTTYADGASYDFAAGGTTLYAQWTANGGGGGGGGGGSAPAPAPVVTPSPSPTTAFSIDPSGILATTWIAGTPFTTTWQVVARPKKPSKKAIAAAKKKQTKYMISRPNGGRTNVGVSPEGTRWVTSAETRPSKRPRPSDRR
jgi:hypothetical protein